MKPIFHIIILSFIILAGCGKDKFETRPQIELKSVDPKFVPLQGTITFRLEFRDKEGDVSDSLFIIRERLNNRDPQKFTDPQDIPTFPDKVKGEMQITYSNNDLTGKITKIKIPGVDQFEPDTMRIGFVARDKAGNLSDTLIVDNIIVER